MNPVDPGTPHNEGGTAGGGAVPNQPAGQAQQNGPTLANTGTKTADIAGLGAALTLGGAVLLLAGRRRRQPA